MTTKQQHADLKAPDSADPVSGIVLSRVTKRFSCADGNRVTAVDQVSLRVPVAEWVHLLGPNGSGKSTLLRIVQGEINQDEGSREVHEELSTRSRYVEQGVARNLVSSMTVLENMLLSFRNGSRLFPSLLPARRRVVVDRVRESLAVFDMGLESRLMEKVGNLSGGQQQAVVAAKVLASDPRLLLLDEFTSALDLRVSHQVLGVLYDYARENRVTVVAVTHDLHRVEGHGDRIVVLDAGHVKSDTTLAQRHLTAREIASLVYN